MYTVLCTLYIIHCTLYTVHYTGPFCSVKGRLDWRVQELEDMKPLAFSIWLLTVSSFPHLIDRIQIRLAATAVQITCLKTTIRWQHMICLIRLEISLIVLYFWPQRDIPPIVKTRVIEKLHSDQCKTSDLNINLGNCLASSIWICQFFPIKCI